MEWKEMTLERVQKERPDLLEAFLAVQKEGEEKKHLEEKIDALTKEIGELKEAVAERDKKIATFELTQARAEKKQAVQKLMREAKIPEKVKYGKDGEIKSSFLNLLERCEKDEEMQALVAEWEETYSQGVISESKEIKLNPNGEVSADTYARMHAALVN